MKFAKKLSIIILAMLMVFSVSMAVACGGKDPGPSNNKVNVTFMVEGEVWGEGQEVTKGRRVTDPGVPTFSDSGYIFTGWYSTATFDEGTKWNFTTGIVNTDTTLYAGYRVVNDYVTEVKRADEALTSSLVWTQKAASNATDYEVKITSGGTETTLTGTVSFDSVNYQVKFTPSVVPQGGLYNVSVKDLTKTADPATATDIMFGGAGTVENPYLVASALDFTGVNKVDVAEGTYFSLQKNITVETSREDQKDFTFSGVFDGNGRTITLNNSNTGLFYKIGASGVVKKISIAGAVATSLYDSVGTVADFNAGRIEKINTTANVESSSGTVGSNGYANAVNDTLADGEGNRGIAGGIVGTNLATGVVYNSKITTSSSSTGTIKARIGGGAIVGYNLGKVELCTSNGAVGAWNSKETGKSTSNYSYSGAVVGINSGIVTKCSVGASGKVLGQRYDDASQAAAAVGTTNINLGGIAGYNTANGSISECYFAGIRVHGDENVGGIAGLNAGSISDCYVEGAYTSLTIVSYIGGRTNIGGIVGKTEGTGSVNNCFMTANVFAYGNNAVAHSIAESATNSVYVSVNPNAKSLDDNKDTNPAPAALIAPAGETNVNVEIEQGYTASVALAETYLATLNGNSKFYFNDTTIKLNFEKEILPEETIKVKLYGTDGALIEEIDVAETGKAIDGPTLKGYKFVGWALSLGGEVAFEKGTPISLYDLLDYTVNGESQLYAVMEERIPNEGLIVAVWGTQINAEKGDDADAIKAAYETYLKAKLGVDTIPYSIEFRIYSESKIAELGAAINADADIDVVIGVGNTANAGNGFDYIARSDMSYEGYTARKVCLMTDTERAMEFYAYITGKGNGVAEITFDVKGTETTGEVSELLGTKVDAPAVEVADGYEFKGWATTENATEAQITASAIGYADVSALLTEGKVTLYPVIAEKACDLVVYIHLSASSTVYITDAEADAVEAAIATLLPNKVVNFVRVTGKNAAGFQEVILSVPNVDVYIGGNSTGDLVFDATYVKAAAGEGHFANTSRKVGILSGADNLENAVVVYNYLTAALEGTEPEEPEDPVEPETPAENTTLKVSVWTKDGTWVTAAELEAIKTGFNTYLTGKGIDVSKLTITFVETRVDGNAVADLGALVNTAGDFDIIVGCGSNVTTKGGVTVIKKADVLPSLIAAERMVASITENTLAEHLYTYLTVA